MKDLFVGPLGRANNHGESRMCAIPHTIGVEPEYEVATDVPSVAEFVTCSLDGRLWVFRRSRRYYVAVLKWDAETQRLVFVSTTILSNANIVGRGIDWLLTDTTIIQALDDEPYIGTANLFADSADTLLYSLILSTNTSQRSNYLQSVNKDYSLLPAVGDWNIADKFLIRKPSTPLMEAYNSMLNVRPLISLEFNSIIPVCGYNVSVTAVNGELWARGKCYIGKCSILPAVFDENGNPQEYYLYISPDYKVSPYIANSSSAVTQNDWANLNILHMGETIYGFLIEKVSSLENGLCYSSDTPKLFVPSANKWLELQETEQEQTESEEENTGDEQQSESNTKMFIDTLNNSGLVLHDDGAIFLNGSSYECKGLPQWLAPIGIVDAVTHDFVIASCDNASLVTHLQHGFFREMLAGKNLPISAKSFSGKRLSVGIGGKNSRKSIQVNSVNGANNNAVIAWNDVYKTPIKFTSYICKRDYDINPSSYSILRGQSNSDNEYMENIPIFYRFYCYFSEVDYYWNFGWRFTIRYLEKVSGSYLYFSPEEKVFKVETFNVNIPSSLVHPNESNRLITAGTVVYDYEGVHLQGLGDKIVISCYKDVFKYRYNSNQSDSSYLNVTYDSERVFFPVAKIPNELKSYIGNTSKSTSPFSVFSKTVQNNGEYCLMSAILTENNSQTKFYIKTLLSNLFDRCNSYDFIDHTSEKKTNSGVTYSKMMFIFLLNGISYDGMIAIFLEYDPEIFDFKSEIERSKFHELDLPQ